MLKNSLKGVKVEYEYNLLFGHTQQFLFYFKKYCLFLERQSLILKDVSKNFIY